MTAGIGLAYSWHGQFAPSKHDTYMSEGILRVTGNEVKLAFLPA
jgi:hypothetical protein